MKIQVKTTGHSQMIDITDQVQKKVSASGVRQGLVHVFSLHTTAAITINENADPAVERDIIAAMNRHIPWEDDYAHMEGNSAAHIKVSLFGPSETVPLEDGKLVLGTWQSLFFCEFDGPRSRTVNIQIIPVKE